LKKNKQHTLIYCLAGKGTRFLDKGITTPKYLLKLDNGNTILETSLKSLYTEKTNNLILILNNYHLAYEKDIIQILKRVTMKYKIKFIDDNNGQAETAHEAIELINDNNWIYFFNGDTVLLNRNLNLITSGLNNENKTFGFIDVFDNNSKKYSYVKINDKNCVIEIKEKIVISNLATTGLYGFKDKRIYSIYFKELSFKKDELYISNVYDKMLNDKKSIKIGKTNLPKDSVVLGTPYEYNLNKKLFWKSLNI